MKTKEEAKLDFEMTVKRLREEREIKRKEYWNDLKPFNEPKDIPEIPRVDEKEYKSVAKDLKSKMIAFLATQVK